MKFDDLLETTLFSSAVCPVGVFFPAKSNRLGFRFISLICKCAISDLLSKLACQSCHRRTVQCIVHIIVYHNVSIVLYYEMVNVHCTTMSVLYITTPNIVGVLFYLAYQSCRRRTVCTITSVPYCCTIIMVHVHHCNTVHCTIM